MDAITTVRSYFTTKRVLGVLLVVVPFLNAIFDWIGKWETAKNIPGYVIDFGHWFSDHQDWIRPVFVLAGVGFIVWSERKRNDLKYRDTDSVNALIADRESHLQNQLDKMYKDLGGRIDTVNNAATENNKLQMGAAARTTTNLYALAFLAYMDRHKELLDIKTADYLLAWEAFQTLATDVNIDWTTPTGGLLGGHPKSYSDWENMFPRIQETFDGVKLIAIHMFAYDWNSSPEYKDTPVWPDVSHLPTEERRTLFKRAWIEHEKAVFQIQAFHNLRDQQISQAEEHLKEQVIPYKGLLPRQGIPTR